MILLQGQAFVCVCVWEEGGRVVSNLSTALRYEPQEN